MFILDFILLFILDFILLLIFIFCLYIFNKFENYAFTIVNLLLSYLPFKLFNYFNNYTIDNIEAYALCCFLFSIYLITSNAIIYNLNLKLLLKIEKILEYVQNRLYVHYLIFITSILFSAFLYYKYGFQAFFYYSFLEEITITNYERLLRVLIGGLIFFSSFLIIVSKYNIRTHIVLYTIALINLLSILFLQYGFNGSRRAAISIFISAFVYFYFKKRFKLKIFLTAIILIIFLFQFFQSYRSVLNKKEFIEDTISVKVDYKASVQEILFNRSTNFDTAFQLCDKLLKHPFNYSAESIIINNYNTVFRIGKKDKSEDEIISNRFDIKNNYFQKRTTDDLSGFPFFYYYADLHFFGVLIYFLELIICLLLFKFFYKRFINAYFNIFLISMLFQVLYITEASSIFLLISSRNMLIFYLMFSLISKTTYVQKNYSHSW